jgi:iron complex outermembrane recepter protein
MSYRTVTAARAILLAGVATFAAMSTPALAQDQEQPAAATNQTNASEAPEENGDIVVTARRRAEELQDVPIAVTAYSGAQLEREGALDITDVGDTTPNVTLEVSRGTNSTLTAFIRGIGQQDPVAGFEQGVGIYLDDVYLNRPQGTVLDIYDVERIEILRGPQGTLYGRNTIGGAVKYVTRHLSDVPELSLRGTVGTYGQLDAVASASYPVADMFRIGVAGARLTRSGFGPNFTTRKQNYDKDVVAGRVSAEIGKDESALLRISGDYTKDKSHARGGHRLIPGLLTGAPVLNDVFDTRGGLDDPKQEVVNKGVAAHGQVEVADGLTLKSITAFRKDKSTTPIDFDALPAVDVDVPGIYKNKQFSQEVQLEVERGKLSGVLGAYYLKADAETIFDVRLFTTFPGFSAFTDSDVHTKTWAVFGDFTYDITDQLSISLGGRYTNDKRHATVFRQSYLGGGSTEFGGLGIPFGAPTSNFDGKRTDNKFTPRASISFAPNENQHFYVSYSQGFKGGGFDPRGQSTQAPDLNGNGVDAKDVFEYMTFEPEQVTSYELGWKGFFFDKRVYAAVALFHAKYKDMQIPASVGCVVNGIPNFCGLTSNAGKARIQGVEFEGNARLFGNPGGSRMNFSWSLGYLNADFKEFMTVVAYDQDGTPIVPKEVNVANFRKIQNTPEWTASGTLNYTTPLADGSLNLNSTLSYRSSSQQFEIHTPGIDQKGFALLDANIVYELPGDHWVVGLHGKNLTNTQYKTSGYNFLRQNPYSGEFILLNGQPGISSALGKEGILTAFYGNPRQIMFTIGYKL